MRSFNLRVRRGELPPATLTINDVSDFAKGGGLALVYLTLFSGE